MKRPGSILRLTFGILMLAATGCATKNINMLQSNTNLINASGIKVPELVIQKGDLLFIGVNSHDPQSDMRYNTNNYYTSGAQTSASSSNILGYLINRDGNIKFPDIGDLKAEGQTTSELEDLIKKKLETYLNMPIVTVRFLNFKITVLGEVTRPGTYQIPTEKISIIEAIGLAGDLTVYGVRNNVMIIREVDNKREYGFIDLTKGDIFQSPYFYLKQNDAIYVTMNSRKVSNADQTTVRNISLGIGIVSAIAIILNALNR
ncbi:MAG: polysaccharide biosynthesis/export family protein [Chitinophagaceae bacterium]